MTVAETREKCKSIIAKVPRDAFIVAVLVLASSASFGLGLLAGRDTAGGGGITLPEAPPTPLAAPIADAKGEPQAGQVVASKNGTKYYLPNCSGADRISEGNKVWFASPAAAVSAGYAPAANCKGI